MVTTLTFWCSSHHTLHTVGCFGLVIGLTGLHIDDIIVVFGDNSELFRLICRDSFHCTWGEAERQRDEFGTCNVL